jgi:hypothetical protein
MVMVSDMVAGGRKGRVEVELQQRRGEGGKKKREGTREAAAVKKPVRTEQTRIFPCASAKLGREEAKAHGRGAVDTKPVIAFRRVFQFFASAARKFRARYFGVMLRLLVLSSYQPTPPSTQPSTALVLNPRCCVCVAITLARTFRTLCLLRAYQPSWLLLIRLRKSLSPSSCRLVSTTNAQLTQSRTRLCVLRSSSLPSSLVFLAAVTSRSAT